MSPSQSQEASEHGASESVARPLDEAKVGLRYIVKHVGSTGQVRKRLMDMGLTKGTELLVRKVAPLGDPIQISIRGFELSLRKADAHNVLVEEVVL